MGIAEYERVRSVAERWKDALRRLGAGPAEVQADLARHGLYRSVPTVANWMGNPNLIGPGDDDDIDAIARVAGDDVLLSKRHDVKAAISIIRGSHIVAGRHLTEFILGEIRGRLGELDERPVLLDLGYGQAWVVQVGSVDSDQQDCPSGQVNRPLWVEDTMF